MTVQWCLGALLLISGQTFDASAAQQMSPDAFEERFQQALTAGGDTYVAARTALLAMGPAVGPPLDERATHAEWRTRLLAEILRGWMNQRALFEECTARVKGKTEAAVPSITGKTPRAVRVKAVQKLGPPVVPRLLEMLLFSRDYANDEERETIFAALTYFKDPRTLEPMMHLASEGGLPERIGSAGVLGHLGDARAVDVLVPLMQDRHAEPQLRIAAATALARIGAPPALELFRTTLADEHENLELRRTVAYLAGLLGPPAAPILQQTIETATDERVMINALKSVGRIGKDDALRAVTTAERRYPEGAVNRAARDARTAIEQRPGAP